MATELTEHGPTYNIDGAGLAKFRRTKFAEQDKRERRKYGEAVEKAVLAKQKSEAKSGLPPINPTSNCASGTWHTTGEAIHNAVRNQQRRALLACAAQIRRARTDEEWKAMYAEAMAKKLKQRVEALKGETPKQESKPMPKKTKGRSETTMRFVAAVRGQLGDVVRHLTDDAIANWVWYYTTAARAVERVLKELRHVAPAAAPVEPQDRWTTTVVS